MFHPKEGKEVRKDANLTSLVYGFVSLEHHLAMDHKIAAVQIDCTWSDVARVKNEHVEPVGPSFWLEGTEAR